MRRISLLAAACLLLVINTGHTSGKEGFSEQKQLYDLLEERQTRFGDYLESLEKKTGFFGSRSRHDMRKTISVLKEIVETDNKIIRILNRAIDFKVFEKSRMNYDLLDLDRQISSLRDQRAVLEKQVAHLLEREQKLARQVRLQWAALALLAMGVAIWYYRKFRGSRG